MQAWLAPRRVRNGAECFTGMAVFNDAQSQQEMLAADASGFVTKENVVTDLISLILKLCGK